MRAGICDFCLDNMRISVRLISCMSGSFSMICLFRKENLTVGGIFKNACDWYS